MQSSKRAIKREDNGRRPLRGCAHRAVEALERRALLSGTSDLLFTLPRSTYDATDFEDTVVAGNNLFATGFSSNAAEHLFVTTGGGEYTKLLSAPVHSTTSPLGITGLTEFGDKAYFFANVPDGGAGPGQPAEDALLASDGTPAGTYVVKVLRTGAPAPLPTLAVERSNRLLFFWDAAVWTSDGTDAGTAAVATADGTVTQISDLADDGFVYFSTSANAIWRTDGTAAGTTRLVAPMGYRSIDDIVVLGAHLFFTASGTAPGAPRDLFTSERSGAALRQVVLPTASTTTTRGLTDPRLVRAGNAVVFRSKDPQTNIFGLFAADGTSATPVQLSAGANSNAVIRTPAPVAGNKAVVVQTGGIYVTDGTVAGTSAVLSPAQFYDPNNADIFSSDGRAYVRYTYPFPVTGGMHWYQTDGTVAGSKAVHFASLPFLTASYLQNLYFTTFQHRIVVESRSGGLESGLWSVDGDIPVASIAGMPFIDANRDGVRQGFEGTLFGMPYIDLTNNGYDTSDFRGVGDPNAPFDNSGAFLFDGLPPDATYRVGYRPDGGLTLATPPGGFYDVTTLQPNEKRTGLNFVVAGTGTLVWGSVFNDLDGDGVRDANETTPPASQTVYLDLNDNARRDGGEPSATTSAYDGTYGIPAPAAGGTFTVRRLDQLGWRQTAPAARGGVSVTVAAGQVASPPEVGVVAAAPGAVTGRVWDDQDFDGFQDPGEPGLQNVSVHALDEFGTQFGASVLTDASGNYTIPNLLVEVPYRVRVTPPSARSYTLANRGPDDAKDSDADQQTGFSSMFVVAPGEVVRGADTGLIPKTTIAGTVYRDANENGRRDSSDVAFGAGVVVFLDDDGDDVLDSTEMSTTTAANGSYSLNVVPGAAPIHVGLVVPAHWATATPAAARTFTVAAVGVVGNADLSLVPSGGAAGRLAPTGGEFRLNLTTDGPQTQPSIGADAAGNVVAAWLTQPNLSVPKQILVRRFSSAGVPEATGEIPVNTAATVPIGTPHVAVAGDGSFVVAWTGANAVFARRFSAGGAPLGDPFTVNETTAGGKSDLQLALDPTGGFAVTWSGPTADDNAAAVARRYDASGVPKGGEFRVNDDPANAQTAGGLAFDGAGRLVVTYTSPDGDFTGAFARRFAAGGAPLGPSFRVNATTTGTQRAAGVAADAAGRTFFLFADNGSSLVGRAFDAGATPLTGEIAMQVPGFGIPQPGDAGGFPTVVPGPDGTFLVAWSQSDGNGGGVFAQLYGADGAALGARLRLNTTTVNVQTWPALAAGPGGTFVAAWSSVAQDGSAEGIYAQRLVTFTGRASVGGAAWTDADYDGIHGAAETPLAGVAVELRTADGVTVDAGTTAPDGTYQFSLLRPGESYRVVFTTPANTLVAPQDKGGDDTRDSDADPATAITAAFNAPAAGGAAAPQDIGLTPAATVRGVVVYDVNGNGIWDGVDQPLPVWRVYLDGDGDGVPGPTEALTVTASDGSYSFGMLPPGTYRVALVPQPYWQLTTAPTLLQQTVTAGQNVMTNVGVRPTGTLGDRATAVGAETRVNTTTARAQSSSAVDSDAAGNYVVVWADPTGILAQRYAANGTPVAGEFAVSDAEANATGAATPNVAVAADGRFVVTWAAGGEVWARRYAAGGASQGAAWRVNTTIVDVQQRPDLAMAGDGSFVVVWQSKGSDGEGVYAQRYAPDGSVRGGEFRATGVAPGDRTSPSVAADANGNFVVSYIAGSRTVYYQRFTADGTLRPGGDESAVSGSAGVTDPTFGADVAMNARGEFVIAFRGVDSSSSGIRANRYDAEGIQAGPTLLVNTTLLQGQEFPAVKFGDDGRFVVAWHSFDSQAGESAAGVRAQWFDGSGLKLGGELRVNSTAGLDQLDPAVALQPAGFVVSWTSDGQDGDATGVYAQRFVTIPATASLGGVVFGDANANGVRDGTDPGRGNILVQLLNDAGAVAGWTLTSAASATLGQYRFDNLLPDAPYRVRVVLPGSTGFTTTDVGADDLADSDVDVSTGISRPVTVAAGNADLSVYAGIITFGQVAGAVYADADADGVRDADDPPLAGWTVYIDANFNGQLDPGEASTTTAATTGAYTFANLRPGPIQVGVVAQPGWALTTPITSRLLNLPQGVVSEVPFGMTSTASPPPVLTAAPGGDVVANPGGMVGFTEVYKYDWFAADAQGKFVTTSVTGSGIYGRTFAADGTPLSDKFNLSGTQGDSNRPAVARAPDGSFAVAWWRVTGSNPDYDIYTRRFSANGTPLGPAVKVNAPTQLNNFHPSIAIEPDGDFVVAYDCYDVPAGGGIYARQFDAAGNPRGASFRVNGIGNGNAADVAVNANGTMAFAWRGQTGSQGGLIVRRFDASGAPMGDERYLGNIDSGNSADSLLHGIAINDAGEVAVAWPIYPKQGIRLAVFDATGEPKTPPTQIGTGPNDAFPDVALRDDGSGVVVWQAPDGDSTGIYMRQFSSDGLPAGAAAARVNLAATGEQYFPALSRAPGGDVLIGWLDGRSGGVRVHRFVAQAAPPLSSAGGFVWNDANANGILDAGEAPLWGVAVDLLTPEGELLGSTTSAADGSVRFAGLTPGNPYTFRYSVPAGRVVSPPDQGADDARDSDVDPLTNTIAVVAPAAGAVDLSAGLGLVQVVPTVRSVVINGGDVQRSVVTSITVAFDQRVTLAAGAMRLSLLNAGGSGANDGSPPTNASAVLGQPTSPDGGMTWVWAFVAGSPFMQRNPAGAPTGSLVDGIYTATLDHTKVVGGGIFLSADAALTFHRLFGDVNGTKMVNVADYNVIRSAFGKSSGDPAYDYAFDFEGDGVVNNADYGQFRNRFGKSFTY